jgi:hypothetical protein
VFEDNVVLAHPEQLRPIILNLRPIEIPRLLLLISVLVATVLVIMSALSSNWYYMYLAYGPGDSLEEHYLFSTFFIDEVYEWQNEGDSGSARERYHYSEFWYFKDDNTPAQVAGVTGYMVLASAACAIVFLTMTIISMLFFLDRWYWRIKLTTSVIAICSMLLLGGALAYFGTKFPSAAGSAIGTVDSEDFGPAFYMAMFACALLGSGAFVAMRDFRTESIKDRNHPPNPNDPHVKNMGH